MLEFPSLDDCIRFVKSRKWTIGEDHETITFHPQIEDKAKSAAEMLTLAVDLSAQISALA